MSHASKPAGRQEQGSVQARDGVERLDFIFYRGEFSARAIADVPKVILLGLKLPKAAP
jgi:hypothetical protein